MDKEKLLKAIEQKRQEIWPTNTGEMKPATVPNNLESGWLNALHWMENLINSHPVEQRQSEDLEDAATALTNEIVGELNAGDYTDHSGHNAHWHSFKEGVVAGADWQKERIMKSAIEGCWIKRNRYTKENVLNGLSVTCDAIQKFRDGDKVRVLILKDDEQ